jgi:ATP-binding cassette, subfamily B, bacterial PglK
LKPNSVGVFSLVAKLWVYISYRRKLQCAILLALTIFSSLSEIVSIGAIFPFLGALLNPEKIYSNQHAQFLIEWLDIPSSADLLLPLTIAFVSVAVISGALRILLIWLTTKLSFAMGADLGYAVYKNTLYQEYRVHLDRNSGEVIDAIQNKTNTVIYLILIPALNLMSAFVLIILVLAVLLLVNPLITLITLASFSAIYLAVIWTTKQRLVNNGQEISVKSIGVLKTLQEGLGSIRDILLDGNQMFYLKIFQRTDLQLRKAQASSTYIGAFPRNIMETLGIVILAMIAFSLSKSSAGISGAIPVLGVAALGAQKLLPILQQAYNAWTNIKVGKDSLAVVLEMLDQPFPLVNGAGEYAPLISFKHKIELRGICFSYVDRGPLILNGVNIDIPKGSRIGFMGKTGGGKSTLTDVLMGLLEPVSGSLAVDGLVIEGKNKAAWQQRIAHVPQAIYLADGTIAENIAFGVEPEKIDYERVYEVASKAQLLSFVNQLEDKFETPVGERGVKLSGGQRQRIGIARALYKNADVFIFDEATSALDGSTESAVMESIKNFGSELTIIIIAHRLSTLKMCEEVYLLDGGNLIHQPNQC